MMPAPMNLWLMESAVPTDWPPWLIAGVGAAALLLLLIVVMRPARRVDGDDAPPPTPMPSAPSLTEQRAMQREMGQLMTELSEMAREVNAQLDARSAKLERLIRDADGWTGTR
jgi:hypothetical protein